MKKIKFLLIIFISLLTLSCSTEEQTPEIELDPIIGEWQPTRFVEVYTNAGEISYESSICYGQSRLVFQINNSLDQQFYDDDNGNCIEDTSFVSGTWQNNSETEYDIRFTYFDDATQENVVFIAEQDEISFIGTDIMRVIFYDGSVGNGDVLEHYYDEYERVE